ncbi:MAG: site-specific DNA-methyltransferase [Geobacteraceae bacterium]
MSDQPEKLDLTSHEIAEDKRQELLRLFPEIRTEGGKLDFERLKLALGEAVDVGKERYGMNWPGKAECFKTIQAPSMGTLRPCPEESVNFDTSENLIIEGDNLEVLKLLQKSYLGKVKMIYIDPPYNTGNDFIYPDNFSESLKTYLEYTGQVDVEGRKFGTNSDTDGRFHSKWLNMMYPRLYLARNLLREDGVIFVSIDDKELHNLRRLCDELFGEENRIGIISWKNVTDNNPTLITPDNEFILCYAKSREAQPKGWSSRFSAAKDLLRNEYERLKNEGRSIDNIQKGIREFISDNEESVGYLSRYKHVDETDVYTGSESVHNPRSGGYDFEVIHPDTGKPMRKPANGYRFPEKTFRDMEAKGIILYGEDENRIVKIKKYLADFEDSLRSVITLDGRLGSYELKRLFPGPDSVFTNPKPSELLESLISFATDTDAVILDFFAGSGSLGHAVLNLNRKDKGNRRFVMLQLPEPCDEKSGAYKAGLRTIAEITKERTRRVIKKLNDEEAAKPQGLFDVAALKQDRGFRVFKLSESNFKPWNADLPHDAPALERQLELHIDHIRDGRTAADLFYEILLKSGYPITTTFEKLALTHNPIPHLTSPLKGEELSKLPPLQGEGWGGDGVDCRDSEKGKTVYSVSGSALFICLERELTLELIRAMADAKPERVVCLDEGFVGNDQLKANAVQIFKTKGVTSFKTV